MHKERSISSGKIYEIIADLWAKGLTQEEIGKQVGYPQSRISQLAAEMGLQERGFTLSQEVRAKHARAYDLMDEGLRDSEIARRMQLEGDDKGYERSTITKLRHGRNKP